MILGQVSVLGDLVEKYVQASIYFVCPRHATSSGKLPSVRLRTHCLLVWQHFKYRALHTHVSSGGQKRNNGGNGM